MCQTTRMGSLGMQRAAAEEKRRATWHLKNVRDIIDALAGLRLCGMGYIPAFIR